MQQQGHAVAQASLQACMQGLAEAELGSEDARPQPKASPSRSSPQRAQQEYAHTNGHAPHSAAQPQPAPAADSYQEPHAAAQPELDPQAAEVRALGQLHLLQLNLWRHCSDVLDQYTLSTCMRRDRSFVCKPSETSRGPPAQPVATLLPSSIIASAALLDASTTSRAQQHNHAAAADKTRNCICSSQPG